MSGQIKTITDKNSFKQILNKYFKNDNVFLKTKDENLKIEFYGCTNSTAIFKIPSIKNISDNNIVFASHGNSLIKVNISFTDKKEDNVFLFSINEIQIIQQTRKEERKSLKLKSEENRNISFITNLISDSIIQNSLSLDIKRIDRIRESVISEMSKAFNFVKIFFCSEGKGNRRMNIFLKKRDPIFISDINNRNSEKENEKLNYYRNFIYLKDYYLQGKKELISEISVPILYKGKLPYGYIQVNNTAPVADSMLSVVEKCAVLIDELMNKEKVFPKSEEKIIVSNISNSGIGIVFRESKYLRYFKKNNYIYFDLLLPDDKVIAIMALVRNIALMDNKIIRIGCSIEEINNADVFQYKQYLDSFPKEENEE